MTSSSFPFAIPLYTGDDALNRLAQLTAPTLQPNPAVQKTVSRIITHIQQDGDRALTNWIDQLNDAPFKVLHANDEAWAQQAVVSDETQTVLTRAAENIRQFAQGMMTQLQPYRIEHPEFSVGLDWRPVESVACYVPAGRYPLPSTALMTAITARAAGVQRVVLLSPQWQPETLAAAQLAKVDTVYQLGGAHGVAAMALGTEGIPKVDMIVGPGNAYVTEAKRQLQGIIGIDMLAGPSEVGIIADDSANPDWVALDLLAQTEHDPEARAYLLTTSTSLAQLVIQQVSEHTKRLDLPDFVTQALLASGIFVLNNLEVCCAQMNRLAPEHLEVMVAEPERLKGKLTQYGALFLGHHTPVPFGDYMMGPNHTLPTHRTARFSGALSPITFLRPQTWAKATANSSQLCRDAHHFASLEGLSAHAASAIAREAKTTR